MIINAVTASQFVEDLGIKFNDPLYDQAIQWFLQNGKNISSADYDQFEKDVANGIQGKSHQIFLNAIQNVTVRRIITPPPATSSRSRTRRIQAGTTSVSRRSLGTRGSSSRQARNINPNKLFCASKLNGPNNVQFSLPWDLNSNISKSILESVKNIDLNLKVILKAMSTRNALDEKYLEQQRKDEENLKRFQKEVSLETPTRNIIQNAKSVLTPIQGILDRIFKFIAFTLLGKALSSIVEWMGDSKNKEKLKVIQKFLKDWWPALLGSYLIFGTRFGLFLKTIVSIVRFGIQTLKWAIKNPRKSIAIGVGTLVGGALIKKFLDTPEDKFDLTPKSKSQSSSDSSTAKIPTKAGGGKIQAQSLALPFGGLVSEDSGLNITGAGPDTQLIAAQPGEIVMNRATVEAVGADKLLALNKKYGGSGANQQKFSDSIQLAQGGGMIGNLGLIFNSNVKSKPKPKSLATPIKIPEHQLPEIQSALKAIRFTEGTHKSKNPYNTLFGFGTAPIEKMTVGELINMQMRDILPSRLGGKSIGFPKDSSGNVQSAAAGAYQFMPNTLNMLMKNGILKMNDLMSRSNQDKAAAALMNLRGVNSKMLRSEGMSKGVMNRLAPEWASVPTLSGESYYNQPTKKHEEIQNVYNLNLKKLLKPIKKQVDVSRPSVKPKFNFIDLPPIFNKSKPQASNTKNDDLTLFSSKFPQRRSKSMETYDISLM